eukprot:m.415403 g.415403  ORF g.415403 m.415403 type:complete len:280 (-) comp29618_c0_seq1:151-990(-)
MTRSTAVMALVTLALLAGVSAKIPTHTICQKLCPDCTTPDCKCDDACWPGQSLNNTSDRDCVCFAELGFCKAGEKPVYTPGKECPSCWPEENTACMCFAALGFCDPPAVLPTESRCQTLCPDCKSLDCKCNDSCWPGKGINETNDHTCECFGELGFCDAGKQPVYTPGARCPSCWPADNTACDCFAAIGFCEPPIQLPTESRCAQLCPDCKSPTCKCDACWPGKGLNATSDHTCECFAELGFCDEGKQPVYTPGAKCPSCWPKENTACDCFAAVGFCGN